MADQFGRAWRTVYEYSQKLTNAQQNISKITVVGLKLKWKPY